MVCLDVHKNLKIIAEKKGYVSVSLTTYLCSRPHFCSKLSSIIIGIIVSIELSMYDLSEFTQPYVGAGTTSPVLQMKKLRVGEFTVRERGRGRAVIKPGKLT